MNLRSAVTLLRCRARTTALRLPLVWMRHTVLQSTDAFVASYPRSGNTWARFLLCEALTGNDAEFGSVAATLPPLRLRGRAPAVLPNGGRLFRTHEYYHCVYRKAIYFVRDPRDVAVSNYEFERLNPHLREKSFDDFLRLYLKGKVNSFGTWRGHIHSWLDSHLAASSNFLLIRYEDMREDTERELTRMVQFLGFAVDPERIRTIVADNRLERMSQKEDRFQGRSPEDRAVSEAGRQVRTRSAGGWRSRLTPEQAALIEHHAGELMARLGYKSGLDYHPAVVRPILAKAALSDADIAS